MNAMQEASAKKAGEVRLIRPGMTVHDLERLLEERTALITEDMDESEARKVIDDLRSIIDATVPE